MVHYSRLSLELIECEDLLEPVTCGLKLSVKDRIHHHILKHRLRLLDFWPERFQQNILDDFAF